MAIGSNSGAFVWRSGLEYPKTQPNLLYRRLYSGAYGSRIQSTSRIWEISDGVGLSRRRRKYMTSRKALESGVEIPSRNPELCCLYGLYDERATNLQAIAAVSFQLAHASECFWEAVRTASGFRGFSGKTLVYSDFFARHVKQRNGGRTKSGDAAQRWLWSRKRNYTRQGCATRLTFS